MNVVMIQVWMYVNKYIHVAKYYALLTKFTKSIKRVFLIATSYASSPFILKIQSSNTKHEAYNRGVRAIFAASCTQYDKTYQCPTT